MCVIFYDKKTESTVTVERVTRFKRVAVPVGNSDTKFRYEWHLKTAFSICGIYDKCFPCSRYEFYACLGDCDD